MLYLSLLYSHFSYVCYTLAYCTFRGVHLGASSVWQQSKRWCQNPINQAIIDVGAQTGYFIGFGTNVCLGARMLEFEHPCMYTWEASKRAAPDMLQLYMLLFTVGKGISHPQMRSRAN